MIAITAYCVPALFVNGGVGVCLLYVVLVAANLLLRATGALSDFDVDALVFAQVCVLTGSACALYAIVKYYMNRTDRRSIPSIQAAAIAAKRSLGVAKKAVPTSTVTPRARSSSD